MSATACCACWCSLYLSLSLSLSLSLAVSTVLMFARPTTMHRWPEGSLRNQEQFPREGTPAALLCRIWFDWSILPLTLQPQQPQHLTCAKQRAAWSLSNQSTLSSRNTIQSYMLFGYYQGNKIKRYRGFHEFSSEAQRAAILKF